MFGILIKSSTKTFSLRRARESQLFLSVSTCGFLTKREFQYEMQLSLTKTF